jgi:hypothetical protein
MPALISRFVSLSHIAAKRIAAEASDDPVVKKRNRSRGKLPEIIGSAHFSKDTTCGVIFGRNAKFQ